MQLPDYKKRIEAVNEALDANKKIVIFIVEDLDSAQYRYRCYNVISVANNAEWATVVFLSSEMQFVEKMLGKISIAVIMRQAAKNNILIDFVKLCKLNDVKVLFDLDDLIFDYRDLFALMVGVNGRNPIGWLGYIWGVRRIAKRVDGFICTNEFLAQKLERSFNKPVKVIRNSLNHEQIEVSEKWVKKKNDRQKTEKVMGKSRKFSVGYFSGSPTHVKDFRLVEDDLIRFLENHDDAVLKVVGYMSFSARMKKMIDAGRVETIDVVDYLRLQGLISKVDVNIAPLVINDFTNCKSELKFFEAAAVETTTIASPTYAFKKAISDGENGFLAQPGEWYEKLEYLHEYPEKNMKIAKKAREYALKHYYGKEFLKEVEAAYDYFAK